MKKEDRERKTITETIVTPEWGEDFFGVASVVEKVKGKYDSIKIEDDGYGEYSELIIRGYRKENDEEYKTRIDKIKEKEKAKRERKRAAEIAQLKELAKKYPKELG